MNIKRQNGTGDNSSVPLFESQQTFDNLDWSDVQDWLKNFPDNAKSWKDATSEIVDLSKRICEDLSVDFVQFDDAPSNAGKTKTPGAFNKYYKKIITDNFKKLDDHHQKRFFADYGKWFTSPIFESDTSIDNKADNAIQEVFDTKSKQFDFSNGSFMGNLLADIDTSFGMKYHDNIALDYGDFEDRIARFVGFDLNGSDKERLSSHYNKYSRTVKR
jgi:flavin-binding protein dodecin